MKNKDPAFLFYPSDFLTGTMFMTNEQVGMYIRLLCSQHQFGHLSEKHMLKICKTPDEDILQKFTKDEDGLYFNERLDEEINKRHKYCESRRNNRKGKTKATERKSETTETCVETYVETYVPHMENENININRDININNNSSISNSNIHYETLFFEFWNLYTPVRCSGKYVDKGSKKLSLERFITTLKSGVNYEDIIAGTKAYLNKCKQNNQLTLAVPTFLNQQRWADDYNNETIDGDDSRGERQEAKSVLATYAEIADEYEQKANIH